MKSPRPILLPIALFAISGFPCGPAASAPPATPQPAAASVVVRSAGGSKTFTVVDRGPSLEILLPGGERLIGEPSGEKRKYRRASGGAQVCEVKPGENGFKLRLSDGKLLWKVKLDADKIKVSDNEENRNPWSLKTKYDDKVKVVDASDKEIAEVRFYPDKTKVKGADGSELWECSSPRRRSAAFGVLALDGIPEEHRAILMAEILAPPLTLRRMLLYYAMGGGLGHLTRARAFLHTLGLEGEAVLFSSSSFATDPRVTGGLPVVRVPAGLDGNRAGLRTFLERTLTDLGARRLVVDALPAGILGELADLAPFPGLELWHVARLLRWERYAADCSATLPRFDVTFAVEELLEGHRSALEAASGEVRHLDLVDPPTPAPEPVEPPYALVVHSGPDEETGDLLACARELLRGGESPARIVVASPSCPGDFPPDSTSDVTWLDAVPVSGLFAGAERIVTAAGFNVMRQAAPFRSKHFVVPYPRRFDDQFTRAARARAPRS